MPEDPSLGQAEHLLFLAGLIFACQPLQDTMKTIALILSRGIKQDTKTAFLHDFPWDRRTFLR